MSARIPFRALVLLASAVGLAVPSAAAADSLVFVKDGNVWLARPDGSGQYQVTSDGGYASPSQADDGTIVAAKGNRYLVRMTQNGTRLNAPLDTISPLNNVQEPRVSSDGSKIAYAFATVTNCGFGCLNARNATAYSYPDHFGQPPGTGLQSGVESPSWNGNGRTLLDGDSNLIWYDDVGGGDNSYTQWFFDCDTLPGPGCPQSLFQPVITRQGDKVAMIRRPLPHDRPDPTDALVLFTQAGDVSTTKPVPVCEFTEPTGGYHDPTWAPSGQAIAWQEGDGIHVARVTSLEPTCAGISGGDVPVIPGASDPNWGPADVNPAPRPAPGPNPGPTPSPGRPERWAVDQVPRAQARGPQARGS